MRKLLVLSAIFIFTISEIFGYGIKVYDEYGNRVGTYRKEGDNFQLYDFNDKKVDDPDALIKNAPDKRTLTEYTRTFYDENMMPIGTWRSGFYGSNGRYYPRHAEFVPAGFYRTRTPYIVRPNANNNFSNQVNYRSSVNYIDTKYPRFHKFQY